MGHGHLPAGSGGVPVLHGASFGVVQPHARTDAQRGGRHLVFARHPQHALVRVLLFGHLGGLFPAFLSDVLQLLLFGGVGRHVCPDSVCRGLVCRAGAHAQRGRPLAFRGEDGVGALWRERVGRCDVRPHRPYPADVARHPARAVCHGGFGLHAAAHAGGGGAVARRMR